MTPSAGLLTPPVELPAKKFKVFPFRLPQTSWTMEEILYWNIMRPGQVDADDIKLRNAEKTEIKQREYLAWLSQEGERRAVNREDMKMEDSRSALLGGYARKVRRETGEFYNSDDVAAAALARRTKEGSTMLQRMDNAVARRRNCRTIGGWGLGNNRKAVMMTGTSGDGLCVGRAEAIVEDIEGDDEEDGSDTKKKQKQKKQQQKFETKTISGVLVQSIGEELSESESENEDPHHLNAPLQTVEYRNPARDGSGFHVKRYTMQGANMEKIVGKAAGRDDQGNLLSGMPLSGQDIPGDVDFLEGTPAFDRGSGMDNGDEVADLQEEQQAELRKEVQLVRKKKLAAKMEKARLEVHLFPGNRVLVF
jgi:hypothetical protein